MGILLVFTCSMRVCMLNWLMEFGLCAGISRTLFHYCRLKFLFHILFYLLEVTVYNC